MSAATARRKTERQRERRRAAARPRPVTEAARLADELLQEAETAAADDAAWLGYATPWQTERDWPDDDA